jgi:endonuclease YncB( thermonuclease family)
MGQCISCDTPLEKELKLTTYETKEFSLVGLTLTAKVVYVYDGDTIHCVVKCPNMGDTLTKINCRLLHIDSPEICPKNVSNNTLKQKEIESAVKSRNYLIERVTDQKTTDNMSKKDIKELCSNSKKLVTIKCFDFDKYGRVLIEIYDKSCDKHCFASKSNEHSINMEMIEGKYAVPYDGGTKKEFDINL